MDRREFLAGLSVAAAGVFLPVGPAAAAPPDHCHMSMGGARRAHPTPRKGITGAKVLAAAELTEKSELIPLFDGIRRIPAIADGIRCNCGCAELPGYYSLLSCYEGSAMAKICPICQGQGRLTVRLHGEGKTLQEIRVAVDAQFG